MIQKPFTTVAVFVFMIVATIHVLRLLYGWEVLINGAGVSMWVSILAAVIAGGLAFAVWRELRHCK